MVDNSFVNVINMRFVYIEFLFAIGYFSGVIALIIVVWLLRNNLVWEFLYILGYIANMVLNHKLKMWFKEPRPQIGQVTFLNRNLSWMKQLYVKSQDEKYGLPSGHMQDVCYTLVFLGFLFGYSLPVWCWICVIMMMILTVVQRFVFKKHTMFQLIAGSFIGTAFAITYIICCNTLLESIK